MQLFETFQAIHKLLISQNAILSVPIMEFVHSS